LLITEDKKTLRNILELIDATIVLHNILIDIGEEEREDWIDDDASAIDDPERIPQLAPTDVLNQAIAAGQPKDERRKRLMYYFEEHFYF
jgi:hypothetical protein